MDVAQREPSFRQHVLEVLTPTEFAQYPLPLLGFYLQPSHLWAHLHLKHDAHRDVSMSSHAYLSQIISTITQVFTANNRAGKHISAVSALYSPPASKSTTTV